MKTYKALFQAEATELRQKLEELDEQIFALNHRHTSFVGRISNVSVSFTCFPDKSDPSRWQDFNVPIDTEHFIVHLLEYHLKTRRIFIGKQLKIARKRLSKAKEEGGAN